MYNIDRYGLAWYEVTLVYVPSPDAKESNGCQKYSTDLVLILNHVSLQKFGGVHSSVHSVSHRNPRAGLSIQLAQSAHAIPDKWLWIITSQGWHWHSWDSILTALSAQSLTHSHNTGYRTCYQQLYQTGSHCYLMTVSCSALD